MLVLTRKQKEVIKIGDNITVTIMRVHGQTVRVGIEAPRDVRVMRGELLARDAALDSTSAEDSTINATAEIETETSPEQPQVIQFRFAPQRPAPVAAGPAVAIGRGPLASFLPSLHVAGGVVESIANSHPATPFR